MSKIKKSVRIIFVLTALLILSILAGSLIGNDLSYRVVPEYNLTPISYSVNSLNDIRYPSGKEYVVEGQEGSDLVAKQVLGISTYKFELANSSKHIDPVNKFIFTGTLNAQDLRIYLQSKLEKLTKSLKEQDNSEKYDNLDLESVTLNLADSIILSDVYSSQSSADIFMKNCNFYNSIDFRYNFLLKDYEFTGTENFKNDLCVKYVVPETPFTTSCTDCTLYPTDKNHPLNSDYAIDVTTTGIIPGGERFSVAALGDLLNLYNAAKTDGHNMQITSGYRSYQNQQDVFEGWVQFEMASGKNRAQAESAANAYSALPGFSEHQLGTTADLSVVECVGIETICGPNEKFWDWLDANAYKYGFIRSYPVDKYEQTGYTSEPWHYRWIGIDLAKEFHDRYQGRSTLNEFLRNKHLY